MPGLVPGIHVLLASLCENEAVDGQVKPGHDGVLFESLML
jgi:hypothetical protein